MHLNKRAVIACMLSVGAVSIAHAGASHYWPFDCDDFDVIGGGEADVQGAVTVVGQVGMGRWLDGVDDYIKIGVYPQLGSSDSMSIAYWVQMPDSPPNGSAYNLLGLEKTNAQEIRTYVKSTGAIQSTWRDDNHEQADVVTTESYCDGLWHHVVMVCDRGEDTTSLYVDGQLKGTDDAPDGDINIADPFELYLGASNHSNGTYGFAPVTFDDLRIYDHALTEQEILDLLPSWMRCPADINRDGVVDQADLGILLAAYGDNCP
jgi:Concanavalin A-like lectin/glucanases superfamily